MKSPLDSQSYERWLVDSCYYEDSSLIIEVIGGVTSGKMQDVDLGKGELIEGVYPVEAIGPKYSVIFEDVIFFQVFDECAHRNHEDQIREDGVIGRLSKSSLLDYLILETKVMVNSPGELMHVELRTGDDWYHVITREYPKVLSNDT